jgi:hypothetical protein
VIILLEFRQSSSRRNVDPLLWFSTNRAVCIIEYQRDCIGTLRTQSSDGGDKVRLYTCVPVSQPGGMLRSREVRFVQEAIRRKVR